MNWAFTLRNKIKVALVLMIVFLVLLIKNFVEKHHVSKLGTSFTSVYEDRLLVEGYIYQLSNHLHVKKIMTDNCYNTADPSQVAVSIAQQDEEINKLVSAYEKTSLTANETIYLTKLKNNLEELNGLENSFVNRMKYNYTADDLKKQMEVQYAKASGNLHALSGIQLAVGKELSDQSTEIVSESSVFSQFGFTMLIILGLIIQMLIFTSRDTIAQSVKDASLN